MSGERDLARLTRADYDKAKFEKELKDTSFEKLAAEVAAGAPVGLLRRDLAEQRAGRNLSDRGERPEREGRGQRFAGGRPEPGEDAAPVTRYPCARFCVANSQFRRLSMIATT